MANDLASVAENITFFGQEVLSQLKVNLVAVNTVRRDYRGAASAAGSIVQVPTIDILGSPTERAIGAALTPTDLGSAYFNVTMVQIIQAIKIDSLQRMFENVDTWMEAAGRLGYKLAKAADKKVLDLWYKVPYRTGDVDGTALFDGTNDIDYLADATRILVGNAAPIEPGRMHVLLNAREAYNIRKLASYKNAYQAGSAAGRTSGLLGNILGWDLHETQQVSNAPNIIANDDVSLTVTGAHSKGATSLVLGAAGTGTMRKGQILSIAGVTNEAGNPVGFSVQADAAISANAVTVTIFPPLPKALAGSDVVTLSATGTTAVPSENLAYHGDFALFVARPERPLTAGGVNTYTAADPDTGLSVRFSTEARTVGGSGDAMMEYLTGSLCVGVDVVRPDLAVRLEGQT